MEMMQDKESQIESMEMILARFLRIGSVIAAILMAVGVVLGVAGVAIGGTLTTAGLIVLVSTPVIRVIVAGLVFLKERDYLFALFCLVVILALGVGMLIGKIEA